MKIQSGKLTSAEVTEYRSYDSIIFEGERSQPVLVRSGEGRNALQRIADGASIYDLLIGHVCETCNNETSQPARYYTIWRGSVTCHGVN